MKLRTLCKSKIIIVAFCLTDEPVTPRMIAVDSRNRFLRDLVDGTGDGSHAARPDTVRV
jgi:hypothetical protein